MLEIGTSGLMSGEGKRGAATWPSYRASLYHIATVGERSGSFTRTVSKTALRGCFWIAAAPVAILPQSRTFITLSCIRTRKTSRNTPARASVFLYCSHKRLVRTLSRRAHTACLHGVRASIGKVVKKRRVLVALSLGRYHLVVVREAVLNC